MTSVRISRIQARDARRLFIVLLLFAATSFNAAMAQSSVDSTSEQESVDRHLLDKLKTEIEDRWQPPLGSEDKQIVVEFTINSRGSLAGIATKTSSGSDTADAAALSAVQDAAFGVSELKDVAIVCVFDQGGGSTTIPTRHVKLDLQSQAVLAERAYLKEAQRRMKRAWFPPQFPRNYRAVATFRIHMDGSVSNQRISESSNNPVVDKSVLRAIENASPFRQLAPAFKEAIDVQFTFDEHASDVSLQGTGKHR
jgi:TonB family protein